MLDGVRAATPLVLAWAILASCSEEAPPSAATGSVQGAARPADRTTGSEKRQPAAPPSPPAPPVVAPPPTADEIPALYDHARGLLRQLRPDDAMAQLQQIARAGGAARQILVVGTR